MNSTKYYTGSNDFFANPRLLDRLNAACSFLMILAFVALILMGLQGRANAAPQQPAVDAVTQVANDANLHRDGESSKALPTRDHD